MTDAITAVQLNDLMDLKREYMNDWDSDNLESLIDAPIEYDDDNVYMSKNVKMLLQALKALESTGGLDFAVLKYPELGETWSKYIQRREEKRKRTQALEKLKSTFSREEMQLLGIDTLVK